MNNPIRKLPRKTLVTQGSWCLLVAVIFAQLQFPIPVAHDHEAVDSSITLAAHVDLRHAGDPDDECGVHWHWVLPGQADASHDQEDASLPSAPPVSVELGVASSATIASAAWHADFVPVKTLAKCFPPQSDDLTPIQARTLFDVSPLSGATFSCAVLCVIRC